jgi:recombinational DNA repair protein RecT
MKNYNKEKLDKLQLDNVSKDINKALKAIKELDNIYIDPDPDNMQKNILRLSKKIGNISDKLSTKYKDFIDEEDIQENLDIEEKNNTEEENNTEIEK